jgi:hypothetical protein
MSWLKAIAAVGAVLVVASCSTGSSSAPPSGPSPYIDGFKPPALAAGYTRFVTPPIRGIAAGTDQQWCQWLQGPAAADMDVIGAIQGLQSASGHHAVLYATTENQPVGYTKVCDSADMESGRFLGGIGAEGTARVVLPPGVVFRLSQGQSLMVNIHFINAGSKNIDGQAVVDINFQNPQPSDQVAGLFANVNTSFTIPPHSMTSADANCVVKQDLPVLLFANHMHQWGASAMTEVIHADGSRQTIQDDQVWTTDKEFNPNIMSFSLAQPFLIKKGETVHTHCAWTGDPQKTLNFPEEMCVGVAWYLTTAAEIFCVDGQWGG